MYQCNKLKSFIGKTLQVYATCGIIKKMGFKSWETMHGFEKNENEI